MAEQQGRFQSGLGTVDFTLLVVGAMIGADVYIVSGFGAALLGPAQLVAWAVAGFLSALIALAFIQCATICPKVGGSYAYAHEAFGPFAGFLTGWALYIGEWVALPVFPLAFATYVSGLLPGLSPVALGVVKVLLIVGVTASNVRGVRTGGRTNDVLTVGKLVPLAILILAALLLVITHTSHVGANLQPFAPLGWSKFGAAAVLIFWAYAGFELAVLPAGEVEKPRRTLPVGLLVGGAIATAFYLLTSLSVVVALPWQMAATSARPLSDALGAIFAGLGLPARPAGLLMSLGALVSIAGVYEVFTLGLARLSYAMAADGLLPGIFARLHAKSGTPYAGLVFQAIPALAAALLFNVASLITAAIFFLGICYVATALAALRLVSRQRTAALHVPGLQALLLLAAAAGLYLSTQTSPRVIVGGLLVMGIGAGAYALRGHSWQRAAELQASAKGGERSFENWLRGREAWLLHATRRQR